MRLTIKTNIRKKKIVNRPIQGGGGFRIAGDGAIWARAIDGHNAIRTVANAHISPDNLILIGLIDIRIRVRKKPRKKIPQGTNFAQKMGG